MIYDRCGIGGRRVVEIRLGIIRQIYPVILREKNHPSSNTEWEALEFIGPSMLTTKQFV
jgi:hypothetical protein